MMRDEVGKEVEARPLGPLGHIVIFLLYINCDGNLLFNWRKNICVK